MFTRILSQLSRPWIKRPRGVAAAFAVLVAFSASSAFAQRGGGGCMSGGSGGSPGSRASLAGGRQGIGGGFANQGGMNQMAQMQQPQRMQGMFNVAPMPLGADPDDSRAQFAERKAYRAAVAEQNRKRQALRQETQAKAKSKKVATQARSATPRV